MNGQNSNPTNDGTFNIFGDSPLDLGSAPIPDPFAPSADAPPVNETVLQPAAVQAPQPPVTTAEQTAPLQPDAASAPQVSPAPTVPVAPHPTAPVQSAPPTADESTQPQNPLAAAVAQAEEKQTAITADALFSKLPAFDYAGATEDISDVSLTFEQLRVEKAPDFPELDDGKRVSWTMEYCSIVKLVPTPAKTVIGELKKEIENSKEFLDALKKAKDKNPACKVRPKITAQSKGIASYKGVFRNLEEAEDAGKAINIIPARDGYVYEMRCTEAGRFIARAENVKELSGISAGFTPALPPVPFDLFAQILAFFRYFMQDGRESEVMVYILWDKQQQEYTVSVPQQTVGKAHISVMIPPNEAMDAERYIHVADIHSHNSMPAYFSKTDNRDELATRVYIVAGMLHLSLPGVAARICVGGRFVRIDARKVLEIPTIQDNSELIDEIPGLPNMQRFELPDNPGFPQEWLSMVSVTEGTAYPLAVNCDAPVYPDLGAQPLFSRLMDRLRIKRWNNYEV